LPSRHRTFKRRAQIPLLRLDELPPVRFSLQGENGAEISSLPMGAFVAVDARRGGQTRGRVF